MLPAPEIDKGAVDWTAWADDPYPLYRRLRDDAPVFWDEPNQTFVLTRYDDVYAVLLDHRRFSSVPLDILEGREPPTSEIRQQDEPRHTFIRGIVAPLFNPRAMRRREDDHPRRSCATSSTRRRSTRSSRSRRPSRRRSRPTSRSG